MTCSDPGRSAMKERQSHGPLTTTNAGSPLAGQKRGWTVGREGQLLKSRNDHALGSSITGTS
jgi:hypothetical protein